MDTYTKGFNIEVLDLLSILAILCGILVIIIKNPIVSVLFLIGLFLSIACYLILINLSYIGLSYLLVYVGAVSILFLFILMLINVKVSELLNSTTNSLTLAILISILFYPIYEILPYNIVGYNSYNYIYTVYQEFANYLFANVLKLKEITFENKVYYVTSSLWDGNLWESIHITTIGNVLYTNLSIWLIITSMILLVAMIGSILITIKQN